MRALLGPDRRGGGRWREPEKKGGRMDSGAAEPYRRDTGSPAQNWCVRRAAGALLLR